MIAKCACLSCGTNIEFESTDEGRDIPCPGCGETIILKASKPVAPAPPAQPALPKPTPAVKPPHVTKARLEKIRAATCYGGLRTVVGVVSIFGYLLGGFILLVAVMDGTRDTGHVGNDLVSPAILAGSIALCWLVAVYVSAQWSYLLIDIADTLIDTNVKDHP